MDFALSEEQEQLQSQARELLARECPTSRVRKIMASESGHDPDLWRAFAEAGWLGILVPEELGGSGLGMLDAAVLLGELGRAVVPGPFLVSSIGAVVALREAGTRAQQKAWLPRIAAGEALATLALAEPPEPRFDAGGVAARARAAGASTRLDGSKLFVEYAQLADLVLVAARSGGAARGARSGSSRGRASREQGWPGVELFALPAGTPGVELERLVSVDETRRPCELRLAGARLPAAARLPRGSKALQRVLDACAVAIAAESLGGAERALEEAVAYVKVRQQFGRPVGSFQAVQHLAAEAVAELEPARSLLWYAAWAFDARPAEAGLAASMAKAQCSEVYRKVARTAVEMHGGIGFTWENDMHLFYKRALANASAFGDPERHQDRVADLAGF
jgi:alkylation response protein AidB-like acyl-CoA dehydrogenase